LLNDLETIYTQNGSVNSKSERKVDSQQPLGFDDRSAKSHPHLKTTKKKIKGKFMSSLTDTGHPDDSECIKCSWISHCVMRLRLNLLSYRTRLIFSVNRWS
jgi:hypothetical protein